MPATNAQKAAAVLMSDSENNQNAQNSLSPANNVQTTAQINTATRRLTQEGLKYEKIKKCTGNIFLDFFHIILCLFEPGQL